MKINCESQASAASIPEKERPLHNWKQAAWALDPVSACREARKFHVTRLNLSANIQSKITLSSELSHSCKLLKKNCYSPSSFPKHQDLRQRKLCASCWCEMWVWGYWPFARNK